MGYTVKNCWTSHGPRSAIMRRTATAIWTVRLPLTTATATTPNTPAICMQQVITTGTSADTHGAIASWTGASMFSAAKTPLKLRQWSARPGLMARAAITVPSITRRPGATSPAIRSPAIKSSSGTLITPVSSRPSTQRRSPRLRATPAIWLRAVPTAATADISQGLGVRALIPKQQRRHLL